MDIETSAVLPNSANDWLASVTTSPSIAASLLDLEIDLSAISWINLPSSSNGLTSYANFTSEGKKLLIFSSFSKLFNSAVSFTLQEPSAGPSLTFPVCWSTLGNIKAKNGFSSKNWSADWVVSDSNVSPSKSNKSSSKSSETTSFLSDIPVIKSSSLIASLVSLRYSLTFCISLNNSLASYVSQNSSLAVDWSNFLALSGFFIPGSSTSILPAVSNLCMLGWVTPNLSILLLKILKDLLIASSTSKFKTSITSWLVEVNLIFSLKSDVENINERPLFSASSTFAYSSENKVIKSFWLFFCAFIELFNAKLKSESVLLFDRAFKTSTTITSNVTFIPPFKSRPKLICLCLQSLYVYFAIQILYTSSLLTESK